MAADTKTEKQGERRDRAIVSLPEDVREAIDARRKSIGESNKAQHGIASEPTRPQLVEAILRDALDVQNGG